MYESHFDEKMLKPSACPFCNSNAVDTLAKAITVRTCWRCRHCDRTWTIADQSKGSSSSR